jgi:hypothetical protein
MRLVELHAGARNMLPTTERRGFQFHLSTLVLLCIFAGVLMGLWTHRHIWQIEESIEATEINAASMAAAIRRFAPDQPDLYSPNEIADWKGHSRFETAKELIECFSGYVKIHTNPRVPGDVEAHDTKAPIREVYLSSDLQYLIVKNDQRLIVYRRTREYGIPGIIQLPFFWMAIALLLGLTFLFYRSLNRA